MLRIITCLALVATISFSPNPKSAHAEEAGAQKAVLITGASSGIGRLAAEQLAAAGYFVYAGARKASDIEALNKVDNIMAVRLDVTVREEIDAAAKLIESEGRGLWGIVNNAGINIIDAKSRIVNISSIAGTLSGGLHGYGMYVMSKHAVEAYTYQLAFEMAGLGVKVSAVEPGNFSSDIGVSRCKRMIANSGNREYRYFPDAIQHALFDGSPKEHYLVVADPFEAMITIGKALEEMLNLNHEHDHSYTREQLIAMMDAEWAILRGEKTRDWGI